MKDLDAGLLKIVTCLAGEYFPNAITCVGASRSYPSQFLFICYAATWSFFGRSSKPWNTCQSMQRFTRHGLRQAYKHRHTFVSFVCLTKPVMGEMLHWLTSVLWCARSSKEGSSCYQLSMPNNFHNSICNALLILSNGLTLWHWPSDTITYINVVDAHCCALQYRRIDCEQLHSSINSTTDCSELSRWSFFRYRPILLSCGFLNYLNKFVDHALKGWTRSS